SFILGKIVNFLEEVGVACLVQSGIEGNLAIFETEGILAIDDEDKEVVVGVELASQRVVEIVTVVDLHIAQIAVRFIKIVFNNPVGVVFIFKDANEVYVVVNGAPLQGVNLEVDRLQPLSGLNHLLFVAQGPVTVHLCIV